ncbi:MAG TPA: cytochrome P450 [Myxococcota bacterium]|nr:cytochrome P450 [Myxococcota bacterium]
MPAHEVNRNVRLMDPMFYIDPHLHFLWMREHAPVYWDETSPDGGLWGVALHEDVLFVAKTPEIFCSRKSSRPERDSYIPSMINLDDPDHKRRRNLVNRGFTKQRVEAHEAKIRAICRELIAAVLPKGRCDFVHEIAAPLPMIMIGDLLGVEPEDRDKLLRWSDEMLGGGAARRLPKEKIREHQAKVALEYIAYAQAVIADRREHPREDLMSVLVHAEIEGDRLSEEEIIQESLLILVGGDETTRHVITGGMLALLQNPDQHRKLLENPKLVPTAVEELLRWVTPIQNMNRTATRDTILRGQKIREGDRLLLLYPSANRDAKVFRDPFRLDVTRTPNQHVAFGGPGTHFCLGASLARLELRVMFEELLAHLPELALSLPAERLPYRPSNFIVGLEEMPVEFPARDGL